MLFSVVVGAEHASPVLLLHGGGLSHRQWTPQLQGLPHLRLIAPDLPEHGRSREAGPFTLDGAARQVLAVLDQHVPGERVAVVGSSLGGAVALQLLRLAPERFTRLLVTGSAAGLSPLAGRLMLSSISVLRWFQEERLVRQALRQFHIPEAYQDVVREDLRLALNSATQRHLTQALLALRLPMGMDLPVLALWARGRPFWRGGRRRSSPNPSHVVASRSCRTWGMCGILKCRSCSGRPSARGCRTVLFPGSRGWTAASKLEDCDRVR